MVTRSQWGLIGGLVVASTLTGAALIALANRGERAHPVVRLPDAVFGLVRQETATAAHPLGAAGPPVQTPPRDREPGIAAMAGRTEDTTHR
jgi:hypothetical protein